MARVRVLILCAALLVAVGAALVVRTIAKGQNQPAQVAVTAPAAPPPQPMAEVLVAKRDLAPGQRIVREDLAWQRWPQDALSPSFIVKAKSPAADPAAKAAAEVTGAVRMATGSPDDLMFRYIGMTVREPFVAGEPMADRKVVRAGEAGMMAVSLSPGMRAMAVPLSAENAAGGFILPGDHVDVVLVRKVPQPGGPDRYMSGAVVKNVKVLAIDQNTGAQKGAAVVGATATLEVPLEQAEALILAKAQGELNLVLRSYADTAGPSVNLGQLAEAGAAGGLASSVVRVYRNGNPQDVPVSR